MTRASAVSSESVIESVPDVMVTVPLSTEFLLAADGAEFHLVPGIDQQRVVCTVAGNTADGRLWWFVDGQPLGETVGDAPFAWTPEVGKHVVTCATADGVTASAGFTVSRLE